jgi:3-oxoacyl-[acyl-carrier protein] reductase
VVGGTRGEGHAIASAFADAGASVTVTGTMMLRELYDTDLSRFDYEQVNLARQESIDHLAGVVRHLDVLVLAATCNLPYGLPPSEHAFVAEAARLGLVGPKFLTTRLRLKLGQSPALGGGCVINTGAVRTWLERRRRSSSTPPPGPATTGPGWACGSTRSCTPRARCCPASTPRAPRPVAAAWPATPSCAPTSGSATR